MKYEDLKHTIFDVEISCFKNCFDTESKPVNLAKWLTSDKYELKQSQIRTIIDKKERDKIKIHLPAITPSALLKSRNKAISDNDKLISHSGFMCIDIDLKDNVHLSDYNLLLDKLPYIQNIAYCGRSVSGTGYYCLIPITNPNKLNLHFLKFNELMLSFFNIKLDISKGANFTDLRIYSYTPDAYYNKNATVFNLLHQPTIKPTYKTTAINYTKDKRTPFEIATRILEKQGNSFEGNKHCYIFALCCFLNKMGVLQIEAEQLINTNLLPFTEIKTNCITYPYNNFKAEFGTFDFDTDSNKKYTVIESAENAENAKALNDNFYLTHEQVQQIWETETETILTDIIK